MNNYRIIKDATQEFQFLVQYKVNMKYLNKWFTYAKCNTQSSADARYNAMVSARGD